MGRDAEMKEVEISAPESGCSKLVPRTQLLQVVFFKWRS